MKENQNGGAAAGARAAVFLDRDGTLVEDLGYLTSAEYLALLPGVPRALRRLRSAGLLLVVVTNQSAVARGMLTEEELRRINDALQAMLAQQGAGVDDFFYCPHLPDGELAQYAKVCRCRKPLPGLLVQAAEKWGIDLAGSFMVGDSPRDVEAGRNAGCSTILLTLADHPECAADAIARDLGEAADMILEALGS